MKNNSSTFLQLEKKFWWNQLGKLLPQGFYTSCLFPLSVDAPRPRKPNDLLPPVLIKVFIPISFSITSSQPNYLKS